MHCVQAIGPNNTYTAYIRLGIFVSALSFIQAPYNFVACCTYALSYADKKDRCTDTDADWLYF